MLRVLALFGVATMASACMSWCNAYTCDFSSCTGCDTCTALTSGSYCASWCNSWTCGSSFCTGCDVCNKLTKAPTGVWAAVMIPGKGPLVGVNNTRFLNWFGGGMGVAYFRFELHVSETAISTHTFIGVNPAAPMVNPIPDPTTGGITFPGPYLLTIDQHEHSWGVGPKPGQYTLSNRFEINTGFGSPGVPVAPGTDGGPGLHLCYDSFFETTELYAIKSALFAWIYDPVADTFTYGTNPVFYCPSSPMDDVEGQPSWKNINPIMLDPFVKSYYIMTGGNLPVAYKSSEFSPAQAQSQAEGTIGLQA